MPPAREPFDPYATLGVSPGADRAAIRRAYRTRARELHPDATGTDTTDAMARLNRARDELIARAPSTPRRGRARTASASASADDPGGPDEEVVDHHAEWIDYWSAWNDPPRRWRSGGGGGPDGRAG